MRKTDKIFSFPMRKNCGVTSTGIAQHIFVSFKLKIYVLKQIHQNYDKISYNNLHFIRKTRNLWHLFKNIPSVSHHPPSLLVSRDPKY